MTLKVGDIIPHFTSKDTNGNDFDSQNYVGQKPDRLRNAVSCSRPSRSSN